MKRVVDVVLAGGALLFLSVPGALILLAIRLTSPGNAIFWSDRIGRNNQPFKMAKFRTMQYGIPEVASHLLVNPEMYLTPIGSFLRRSSLDELPQLWNIVKGEMSLVGPRPALSNQYDLIDARNIAGVQSLLPGLTGWAQVNGRDEISIEQKVAFDIFYLNNQSCLLDLKIIWMTFVKVPRGDGVTH